MFNFYWRDGIVLPAQFAFEIFPVKRLRNICIFNIV